MAEHPYRTPAQPPPEASKATSPLPLAAMAALHLGSAAFGVVGVLIGACLQLGHWDDRCAGVALWLSLFGLGTLAFYVWRAGRG